MSKSASIAIVSIICVIALFFGVFACLPDGLEYGDYNEYHAPINLIQGSSLFNDSIVVSYDVNLDEDAQMQDVISKIRARLGNMYGYYFCNVTEKDGDITVQVPVTANGEDVSANSILTGVTAVGKVEILTSSTYAEDDVILTSEHVKSMRFERYTNGANAYYIVNMKFTPEGEEIAAKELVAGTSNWSAYVAIDGSVVYGAVYGTNGRLQVYTSNNDDAHILQGLVKSGSLGATLTETGTERVSSVGGMVFAIVMGVILLACWIVLIVRYKVAGFALALSQLVAAVAFIMFSGMVYFSMLTIASAVGTVLGIALMMTFSVIMLEKIRSYRKDKTYASARHRAFADCNKWTLIVHAIALVLGVVLWLIPTGVTLPLGNALVYGAVLSFAVNMGLGRLLAIVVAPLVKEA